MLFVFMGLLIFPNNFCFTFTFLFYTYESVQIEVIISLSNNFFSFNCDTELNKSYAEMAEDIN